MDAADGAARRLAMTDSKTGLGFGVLGSLAAALAICVVTIAMGGCGSQHDPWGNGSGSSSGAVLCIGPCNDASVSSGGSSGGATGPAPPAIGTVTAPDCAGCTFPPGNAMPCASSAPAIKVVYPTDGVLVPPNMNVISIHWTPFSSTFKTFSVDFSSPPNTDWHIITKCSAQTIDAQSNAPSGGCELVIDPMSWSMLSGANRGGNPVVITVRGTTDGSCASSSTNQVNLSFAEQDLVGTYYYWKSTVSPNGVGGQIWAKIFGDLGTPEKDVTTPAIRNATCNGCHSLSRDGSRMVVYSDDDDSDDEYSDVAGSLLDLTTMPNATEFTNTGVTGVRQGGQPPGFSTINPVATYYVTSNGYPCGQGRGGCGTSTGYPGPVPTNGWSLWNGQNATFVGGVTIGPAMTRPTMPDWSVDGTTLVYVVPAGEFTWRQDDAHIYGGSLYTVPYTGNGAFGNPSLLLASTGENNYYPSYSPDVPMSYVIFNRVENMGQGNACNGGFCPDDSFSNPAARLLLMRPVAGATPIDLEKANGSPVGQKVPLSNSYPRWAPFVQTYHGGKLLWFTFSSTRDYGVRVLNHKQGMYQCYPSDAAETPGGRHQQPFAPQCQEPQLWMAPINLGEAQGNVDPSRVAFWIPYQDITTHNHTAQWTWVPPKPGMTGPCTTCSMEFGPCGSTNGCACCSGQQLTCDGNGQCILPSH
jgi:hypothetical protein